MNKETEKVKEILKNLRKFPQYYDNQRDIDLIVCRDINKIVPILERLPKMKVYDFRDVNKLLNEILPGENKKDIMAKKFSHLHGESFRSEINGSKIFGKEKFLEQESIRYLFEKMKNDFEKNEFMTFLLSKKINIFVYSIFYWIYEENTVNFEDGYPSERSFKIPDHIKILAIISEEDFKYLEFPQFDVSEQGDCRQRLLRTMFIREI